MDSSELATLAETLEATRENMERYFPPNLIGPTWQKENGQWLLPERTLGWHVLAWIRNNLSSLQDDGPFTPTPEQARFILWWYALDDHNDFTYRQAVLQRLKGWGKDPLAAVLCLVELIGPCLYSHDDKMGNPRGKSNPNAWVALTAVSLGQSANTRQLFPKLLPQRTRQYYDMEVQSEIIWAGRHTQKLTAYGTNARSTEGMRVTFLLCNETQHWLPNNGGVNLYETMFDNASKAPIDPTTNRRVGGRILSITNAFNPGENSVAEQVRTAQEAVWDGRAESDMTLYDSIEANANVPMNSKWAPVVIETIRGDAKWLTWDGVKASVLAGNTPPSRKRRMWYNQIVSTEESLFTRAEIDAITDHTMLGTAGDLQPGDEITLGFDGGRTDDSTALIAFRIKDKLLVPIHVWEKPEGADSWSVDTDKVDHTVHWAFTRFKVRAFYADVHMWDTFIRDWSEEYREVLERKATADSAIGFDMRGHRKAIAKINEEFLGTVRDQGITLNGDETLRRHMMNAEAYLDHLDSLYFRKKGGRESPRKIDALVAATLAYKAYRDLMEAPKKEPKKKYNRGLKYGRTRL